MIDNPFALISRRLDRLESLLLELKATAPRQVEQSDRCSLKDALKITGLSKSKLYKLTASNDIPHKRFGNRLVFSRKALLSWIEFHTVDKQDSNSDVSLSLAASANRKRKGGACA